MWCTVVYMSEAVTYRTGNYYGDATMNHIWEITDEHGVAAELYVSTARHEIMNIEVRGDRRGEGLARAIYTHAAAQMPIYHAPVAHRTDEGNAFAEAVGGETIEYDCDCYGCASNDEEY